MQANIALVGPMGAGKTTLGKLLAESIGYTFVDLDAEIESRAGASVSWIFDVEGESGFRAREQRVLADLLQQERQVIATGGGAVTTEENRIQLRHHAYVVYLEVSPETIFERTQRDTQRPLLQVDNKLEVIKRICEQREPLYHATADFVFRGEQFTTRNAVKVLLENLQQIGRAHV